MTKNLHLIVACCLAQAVKFLESDFRVEGFPHVETNQCAYGVPFKLGTPVAELYIDSTFQELCF